MIKGPNVHEYRYIAFFAFRSFDVEVETNCRLQTCCALAGVAGLFLFLVWFSFVVHKKDIQPHKS